MTGAPIRHRTASVTIIHDSCAMADAIATALMVLGEEKGLKIANKTNIAAFFISKTKEGKIFKGRSSRAFAEHLKERGT